MPSHEEHCQDSLRRYGKRFDELHSWMDEPSTILGPSHRKYRHDPNKTPQIARVLFGSLADQACLDHIRLDELESRRKGVKRTREPQIPARFAFGFLSLLLFIIGVVMISSPPVDTFLWVFALLIFFFPSFLFFLAFVGSLSQSSESKRKRPPEELEEVIDIDRLYDSLRKVGIKMTEGKDKGPTVVQGSINKICNIIENTGANMFADCSLLPIVPSGWKFEIIPPTIDLIPPQGKAEFNLKLVVPIATETGVYDVVIYFKAKIKDLYEAALKLKQKIARSGITLTPSSRSKLEQFTRECESHKEAFTKLEVTVVSREMREEWSRRSLKGEVCGVLGCNSHHLVFKCPKCNRHFCDQHKEHLEDEEYLLPV